MPDRKGMMSSIVRSAQLHPWRTLEHCALILLALHLASGRACRHLTAGSALCPAGELPAVTVAAQLCCRCGKVMLPSMGASPGPCASHIVTQQQQLDLGGRRRSAMPAQGSAAAAACRRSLALSVCCWRRGNR